METPHEVGIGDSLFSAIRIVADYDYVLVRAEDKQLCGIITATDLTEQFQKLAEPFLLAGEIENGVRRMLYGRFTKEELCAAKVAKESSHGCVEIPCLHSPPHFVRSGTFIATRNLPPRRGVSGRAHHSVCAVVGVRTSGGQRTARPAKHSIRESQRDSIIQPRVGAERLPWVVVQKIINPNGVGSPFPFHRDLIQPSQG